MSIKPSLSNPGKSPGKAFHSGKSPGKTFPSGNFFRRQNWTAHLAALGLYCGLTLFFAWPVLLHFSSATVGDFPIDRNQYFWNMWWFHHSIFEIQASPFSSNLLYYPFGVKLYLQSLSLYNLWLGLPLYAGAGAVPAFNFLMLVGFPTSGYGGYLLGRYLLRERVGRQWGALLVGLGYSFGPYHYAVLRMEWLNLVAMQWIPLFVLLVLRLEKTATRRQALQAGGLATLVLLLSLLTDYYYTFFLLIFCGLRWAWKAGESLLAGPARSTARKEAVQSLLGFTLRLGGVFGVGALLFSPLLWPTLGELSSGRYQQLGNVTGFISHTTDLAQLFFPPANNPWWGKGLALWQNLGIKDLNNWGAVPGYSLLALAVLALSRRRGLWFWAVSGLVWLVLSGGAYLRVNTGNSGIPLPGRYLNQLPLFNVIRFPERYFLMASLSLCVLAGYGLAWLGEKLEKLERRRAAGGISRLPLLGTAVLALVFLEFWPGFWPYADPAPIPTFTAALAGGGVSPSKAVFEFPVTKHGPDDTWRLYNQIFHGRPIAGGYLSRDPLDYYRIGPFALADWVDPEQRPAEDIVPAKTPRDWQGLLNYLNFGFVVIYPGDYQNDASRVAFIQEMVRKALALPGQEPPSPYYREAGAIVYTVPPGPLEHPLLVLGKGWNGVEMVDKARNLYQRWIAEDPAGAEVIIPLPEGIPAAESQGYRLKLQMVTPDKPRHLSVLLNRKLISSITVLPGETSLTLLPLKLAPGDNILSLVPDPAEGYFVPALAGGGSDTRKLRLGVLSLELAQE